MFARSLDQLTQGKQLSRRIAQYDAKPQRLVRGANSPDHLAIIQILRSIQRDASHGPGEFDELFHLPITMRRQCHNRDAAELLQCKIKIRKLDNIRQLHNQSVERFESLIEEI